MLGSSFKAEILTCSKVPCYVSSNDVDCDSPCQYISFYHDTRYVITPSTGFRCISTKYFLETSPCNFGCGVYKAFRKSKTA